MRVCRGSVMQCRSFGRCENHKVFRSLFSIVCEISQEGGEGGALDDAAYFPNYCAPEMELTTDASIVDQPHR